MTSPSYTVKLDEYDKATEDAEEEALETTPDNAFPQPILNWPKEDIAKLSIWLDSWLNDLIAAHQEKLDEWEKEETAYRAMDEGPLEEPFVGAPGHVVPLIAMAVDPILARLDTGIFKATPVFQYKALRKSFLKYTDAVSQWTEYYQKHRMKFRKTAVPRMLEFTKHGTMVFKVVQHKAVCKSKTYDKQWKVVDKTYTTFFGPQIFGVSIKDFMFPPHYQELQDCPIVIERQRVTWEQLKSAEISGKIANVDKILGQENTAALNPLELARADSANHIDPQNQNKFFEIYECWFDYLYKGTEYKLCAIYHRETQTFLGLRLNYYFHQKKPYVAIPYSVTNDSLWGIGIAAMVLPFQNMLTKWDRSAMANAMLANIRMLIARKDSDIEARPKFYTGRVFRVDDPTKDLLPFNAAADIYPSTLTERQNIIGLAEKRTGVSDYLTGRESPIVGSRATATSTMALIQEGTKRVEEVLENIRVGFSEAMEMVFSLWIQYGLGDIKDIVFGGDEVADLLTEFFGQIDDDNLHGALAIDLSASDAANNRSVQQQTQLAIIQVMMNYLEKVIQAGQMAVQAQQQSPQLAELIGEAMTAARQMFRELLTRYDIRNPEEYLPDLEQFLAGIAPGSQGGAQGQPNPAAQPPQLSIVPRTPSVPQGPGPAIPAARGPATPGVPGSGPNLGV